MRGVPSPDTQYKRQHVWSSGGCRGSRYLSGVGGGIGRAGREAVYRHTLGECKRMFIPLSKRKGGVTVGSNNGDAVTMLHQAC
jgi:hypothetical protein